MSPDPDTAQILRSMKKVKGADAFGPDSLHCKIAKLYKIQTLCFENRNSNENDDVYPSSTQK